VYAAIRKLYEFLYEIQTNPVSGYILRSKLIRMAAAMQHELASSDFIKLLVSPVNIDNVLELLPQQILLLLDKLNSTAI
jgi:hypothetical protein